jgi:hypothetical protein
MDSSGLIHMSDEPSFAERLARGELRRVPKTIETAALEAKALQRSLFDSRNRRAAGWARHSAEQLLTAARKKQRNRKANRAARIARKRTR